MLTLLLYHGVTASESEGIENFSGKHISAQEFEEHIKHISENCNVLSMDDIVELHKNNQPYPDRAVAVTFDDGFENNHSVAVPILEKYNCPAVFYITAGIIETEIMFWVDKIEDCINRCQHDSINIQLDEMRSFDIRTNEEKIDAVNEIKSYCKKATSAEKNRVIDEVIAKSGITPAVRDTDNYKKMSWQQVREIHEHQLFTIGGHSMYHDVLSSLPENELRKDIKDSIDLLSEKCGDQIVHYAYPEGQEEHYNQLVIDVLKENGVICSPSAISGVNQNPEEYDLFNLRRIMPGFMGATFPEI